MAEITKDKSGTNIHAGHRNRLRSKFLKYGYSALEEHEILEMILYYVIPRRDTNPIAHELIKKYGSLTAVLDASVSELAEEKYLSETGAVLLKMFARGGEICDKLTQSRPYLGSPQEIISTVTRLLMGIQNEELLVLCIDKRGRLIRHFTVKGTFNFVALSSREFLKRILASEAIGVVIGHNHPGGDPTPSNEDLASTVSLIDFMASLDIELYDHVIVGENKSFSFAMNGLIPKRKNPKR